MRYKVGPLCFGILILVLSAHAGAERRVDREGAVILSCAQGKVVEIVVEAGVAHLVRSGNPSALKVEHTAGRVYATPLTVEAADLIVIDRNGRSFRLKFVKPEGHPETGSQYDERVVLAGDSLERKSFSSADGGLGFLRSLAAGKIPPGSVEHENSQILLENESLRLTVTKAYSTPALTGYVVLAENLLGQALVLPVQRLSLPGLLFASAEKDVLNARGKDHDRTLMYMVMQR